MREAVLTGYAKAMRREPTSAELRLWLELRAKRFGETKFRPQKVIGRYIVDFASRDPMLVIELDGDTHAGREAADAARTRFLEAQGYQVIRFTNAEVMGNMDGVLTIIASYLPTPPLPTLSPEGERAL